MSNKFVLLSILLVTAVFISGCIFDKNKETPVNKIGSDIIPAAGLPPGFTYMGTHDAKLDIGGSSVNATEGVYRNGGDDMYIQVIQNDKPETLLAQYKLQLKQQYKSDYNPFEDISFNGHNATKVTDYTTVKGEQKARYSVMWTNETFMILVGSSFDPQVVSALATATGH